MISTRIADKWQLFWLRPRVAPRWFREIDDDIADPTTCTFLRHERLRCFRLVALVQPAGSSHYQFVLVLPLLLAALLRSRNDEQHPREISVGHR